MNRTCTEPSHARRVPPDAPVSHLVSRPAVGVESTATLAEAAGRMRLEGVSALLVDGGAAILTERDISRAIGAGGSPDEQVSSVASPHPLVVEGSDSILEAGGLMLRERVRHVVVAMPDRYPAVVSQRDIVEVLLRDVHPALWAVPDTPSENWLG